MFFRYIAPMLAMLLSVTAAIADEQRPFTEIVHQGIHFVAFEAAKNAKLDSDSIPPKQALKKIIDAHDLLYSQSERSARAIDRLRKAGPIAIVYDPHFPPPRFVGNTIAAFFPDKFDVKSGKGTLLFAVGRYGIHWPTDELGVVLAHELLGHGIQHLEGRDWTGRLLDIECEAFLWTEQANQDLKIDKFNRYVISLRREIEKHWCSDFIRWSAKNQPEVANLWNSRDPDIPALVAGFKRYAAYLEKITPAQRDAELNDRPAPSD